MTAEKRRNSLKVSVHRVAARLSAVAHFNRLESAQQPSERLPIDSRP